MSGCPLRNFEECPEHSRKGGCEWWMAYASNTGTTEARVEGCAMVVGTLLQLEHANALGRMAGEVRGVACEMSSARAENVKEGAALRQQLFMLAAGERVLVNPDHAAPAVQGAPQDALGEG